MSDLTRLPTPTLETMKARLTNWIVYIAFVDVLLIAALMWMAMTGPPTRVIPFVPLLTLPAIALVPFLRRTAAIRRELEARKTPA